MSKPQIKFWSERRQEMKKDLDSRRLPCAVAIPQSKFVENELIFVILVVKKLKQVAC